MPPTPRFPTDRERQILAGLAEGKPAKQLAAELGVSKKTVDNLRATLFHKLGARTGAQAMARAKDLGLVPGPHASIVGAGV
jgi:DNA-binding NarL/FixJ family response regulator